MSEASQVLSGPDGLASDVDVLVWPVPADQLARAAAELAGMPGARLADLFASDGEDVLVRLVYALDADRRYVVVQAPVTGSEYPLLSEIAPAAFYEECEIYEQFALRPAGSGPLNRVALPPNAGPDFPRLGHAPLAPPREVHAPHVVGGHAFEFPTGPVRAAGVESLYVGLVTSGEEVVDLYLFTWHKHRGLELQLRGLTPDRALFLVERVEGTSAVANGWAFAQAVETAVGVRAPEGASRTRAVALELERVYNHVAALAALGQSTGLSVGQAAAESVLERLLRLNAAAFGHRYLFGVVEVGGVSRGPDASALRAELPAAHDELRRVADALLGANSFVDRLEATGILTGEQARRLALVGPLARAAGIDTDARRDHPAAPYHELAPAVPVQTAGDALARLQVMLAEVDESVRLVLDLLDAAVGDRVAVPGHAGAGLGWAESSRGESLTWVQLNADGRLDRVRLRPGSARNWRGFDDAVRSQNVFTDVPIIEASFWLTVAGVAR